MMTYYLFRRYNERGLAREGPLERLGGSRWSETVGKGGQVWRHLGECWRRLAQIPVLKARISLWNPKVVC